jgi:hypothetical protein
MVVVLPALLTAVRFVLGWLTLPASWNLRQLDGLDPTSTAGQVVEGDVATFRVVAVGAFAGTDCQRRAVLR